MKHLIVTLLIAFSAACLNAQDTKLNIALVSDLDTFFTVFQGKKERKLEIKLQEHWKEYLEDCSDSNRFDFTWEEIPEGLVFQDYTNGFMKANPKFRDWFSVLNEQGYEMIIFLCKAHLWGANVYGKISGNSYGMDLKKNYAFSLNRIIIYDAASTKILKEPHQPNQTLYYVNYLGGENIDIPLEELENIDVMPAVHRIKIMDEKTVTAISYALRSIARKKF